MAPKSNVWHYFKKDLGSLFAVCKQCGMNVKTSGNTQNLWKHLDIHHPQTDADKNMFKKRKPKSLAATQVSSGTEDMTTSNTHLSKVGNSF